MSSEGNRVALIVACDRYSDPDLKQLQAPTQDAERFARLLEDRKIGGFKVTRLINEPYYTIREKIDEFVQSCNRDDTMLLYFSCHGVKDKNGQLYFATITTNRKRLFSTGIESNFVNNMLDQCRAQQKIVLLDCCYSGAFEKGRFVRADDQVNATEFFGRGSVVITASDAMQYAFEGDDKIDLKKGGSYFTNALVEGLESGNADVNSDGKITYSELYNFVHDHVRKITPDQTPTLNTRGVEGDFVVFKNLRENLGSDESGTSTPRVPEDIGGRQVNDPILGFIEEAKTFLENEQYDKAIKTFNGILMLRSGHIEALNGKGVALCKQKKYEEALECFREVLKIKPKHAEASVYVDMITDRISKGVYAEEKSSDKVTKQQAELEKRTEEKVIKALDESKQISSEVSRYRPQRVTGADPRNPYNDPTLPYYTQNLGKKSNFNEHIESVNTKTPYLRDVDAHAWNNKGANLRNLGKYEEAISCFDKALEIHPNHKYAWLNKAISLYNLGKYEEAIKCYDKAIELGPNDIETRYYKANALLIMRRYEQSIIWYNKALEVNPNHPNAWNKKGLAFYHLGKYEEAIKCYDKAIQLNPNYSEAWYNKGTVLDKQGNNKYADKCFRKAKEVRHVY